ncbi:hypothetical protein BV898_02869 [Hypsibius exemplaris]|uniref:Uncharacterized protein n=1 Tax=Hypsibius exemplaris TaxID=2072580 RepID=A0A1W0X6L5_HYPEX|nr:hypothetical protein BV898_02869 [Hypsibius exemplaris]
MRNDVNGAVRMGSTSATEDDCSGDDSDYKYISPNRLKKQAWLVARQRIMSNSDDDEEFFDEEDYCSVDEPRGVTTKPFRPQTAPAQTQQNSTRISCEPSAFSRPSRFRSQTTVRTALDRKCGARSGADAGVGDRYGDGSEIRHTVKSRDMSTLNHLRRCVVDQIDFIKQRDGVWSNAKLYDAVTVLGNFMQENGFRYIFLPDHQREWLEDMVSRLDQWTTLNIPFSTEFLQHRANDERRRKYKEKVDAACYRLINPQNFEKQQAKKRAGQALIHRETVMRRKIDQDRRQARLDLIENRTRDPTRRNRIAQQQMPIEMRPHRNPRGSQSLSREPLTSKTPIKLTNPLRAPHRPFKEVADDLHAAKMFGDGIHGRLKRQPSPKRGRPGSRSSSLAIRRAVATKSARLRPKTAGNCHMKPRGDSDVSVAPDDLVELLQLIQDIEDKQREINNELLILRKEADSGSHRPGISEAWWEGKSPGNKSGHRRSGPAGMDKGKKCLPRHVSEAWWEGKESAKPSDVRSTATEPDESEDQQRPSIRESWWSSNTPAGQLADKESDRPHIRDSWWQLKQAEEKENCRPKLKDTSWDGQARSKTSRKGHPVLNRLEMENFTGSSDVTLKGSDDPSKIQDKVWLQPPYPVPRQSKKPRIKSVGPPNIPEVWWKGAGNNASMKPRALDSAHLRTERVDTVARNVYSDVDSVLNQNLLKICVGGVVRSLKS